MGLGGRDELLSPEEAMAVVRDKQSRTRRRLNGNIFIFGVFGAAIVVALAIQVVWPHLRWIAPVVWALFVVAYAAAWARQRRVQRSFGLRDDNGALWAIAAAMMTGCLVAATQFHGLAATRAQFVVLASGLGLMAVVWKQRAHALTAAWLLALAAVSTIGDSRWEGWLWGAAAAGYFAVAALGVRRARAG